MLKPFWSSCDADDELAPKDRTAIDQFAVEFVQKALGANLPDAYALFTDDAKANLSLAKFEAMFKSGVQPLGPFRDLHVTHTYRARLVGGNREQRVVCGNRSRPGNWVAVSARSNESQAYAVVEAQTLNNTWAFVLWLLPRKEHWSVQYVQCTAVAMVGKSAEDFLRMAELEKSRNHNFSALLFYETAFEFTSRAPFLQLGTQPEIQKAMQSVKIPQELQGPPPFHWQFGPSSFTVLHVGPLGVRQKIYLQIDHEMGPWTSDQLADQRNHDLISAFAKVHPEYRESFAGLVVRAHERGGTHGFATVSENDVPPK